MKAILAACLLAAALDAQVTLRVHLDADPGRNGPDAILALRELVLGATEPLAACTIEATWPGTWRVLPRADGGSRGHIAATVAIGERATLTIHSAADGQEHWRVRGSGPLAGTAGDLLASLGIDSRRGGEATVDLAALVGTLLSAGACADARAAMLTLLAGHCGEVTFVVEPVADGFAVRGHSAGGLLLPAVVAFLAADDTGFRAGTVDAWVLVARAARDARREEAVRQLGGSKDPRARDVLVRLLHADDYTRVVAMEAIARRGEADLLPALVAATSPKFADAAAITRDALASWLPRADHAARAAVRREAAQRGIELQDEQVTAGAGGRRLEHQDPTRSSGLVVLTLTFLVLVGLIARERGNRGV